jgi:nucleotide-binding universal stress UspA family protein
MTRITRILVPTDFSIAADAALEYAFDVAERFGASIKVLHVLDDPFRHQGLSAEAYIPEAAALNKAVLEDARERLRHRAVPRSARVPVETEVLFGHGARTIAEYAAGHGIDLIVMGTHGRTGFAHLMVGSVAERMVRTAPCPVLTVRHPDAKTHLPELTYDEEHIPA